MNDTLYCPFMGGNPCMGRSCACAVYDRDARLNRTWWCGMVPCTEDNVLQRPIEKEVIDE